MKGGEEYYLCFRGTGQLCPDDAAVGMLLALGQKGKTPAARIGKTTFIEPFEPSAVDSGRIVFLDRDCDYPLLTTNCS
jgi:hypothetical protein